MSVISYLLLISSLKVLHCLHRVLNSHSLGMSPGLTNAFIHRGTHGGGTLSSQRQIGLKKNRPTDNLMEMLTFCTLTTHFRMGSHIYQQDEGLAMGSPLSPAMANIYMEYFEEMALESISKANNMVDDTFILWPHQEDVHILLDHVMRTIVRKM